jgi:hypothetical protein
LGLPLSVHRLKTEDFQYTVDKMASKLPIGQGKYVTTAGRATLIRSVIVSIALYPLTVLPNPKGILEAINKLERAFLWATSDKVSGGKCKVKWDIVCKPKNMGRLGILGLEKFGRALRLLRWPWLEWTDPGRPWRGMGKPCNEEDMKLLYAFINVYIGNEKTAKFWHCPWLGGAAPKDIALHFFLVKQEEC